MRIVHLFLGLILMSSAWGQRIIPAGSGITSGNIRCSAVYDGKVVLGGIFSEFNGQQCHNLIGWDGVSAYEPYLGLFTDSVLMVRALTVFQGDLIAAGTMSGGNKRVMRWDGSSWTMIGGAFAGTVHQLVVHNGQLIAAGSFTAIGGVPMNKVAIWDGTAWLSLGEGFDDEVRAMAVHNDTLYAGGRFRISGNGATVLDRIALWNGLDWAPVTAGLNGSVLDLMSTPNGLWITGEFTYDMDSTVAVSGACSHGGSLFSSFPLPPMLNHASLFHSVQFGYGLSSDGTSWLGDGSDFRRTGCWNIERVEPLNGSEFAVGSVLQTDGGIEYDIGRLLPGNSIVTTDIAGVRFGISPNNGFYFDPGYGRPNYSIPANTSASTVFAISPCAAGVSSGLIYASRPSYPSQGSNGFWPGPICADTSASYRETYLQAWSVDKGMIWDHADHWSDPGYIVPQDIASWPGNGDVLNGEPARLSPFQDLNNNGTYEPEQGETPLIRGDKEAHFILSSRYPVVDWPFPTGLEIGVSAYSYNSVPGDTLWHTSFLNLKYVNRSVQTYDTLLLGFYSDLDLGCSNDDYIGCDTALALAFSFNGDDFDENCNGAPGHGGNSPSFGMVSLNANMYAFGLVTNSSAPVGFPLTPSALLHRMNGRRSDGSPIIGSCTDPLAPETKYMYSGDVMDPTGFTEMGCANAPADRRFISSYGPYFNVAPGDTICLELALVFAQDTLGDNITSVTLLKQKAAAVKAWYDQSGLSCTQDVALGMPATARAVAFLLSIAPNPATDQVRITVGATEGGEMRIISPTGQLIRSQRYAARATALDVDLAGLSNGTYLLQALDSKGVRCGHLVVLH